MTKKKIYIASKKKHADRWIKLREGGANIISTWIDKSVSPKTVEMYDLCQRCIQESLECDAMIVYSEQGDYLKGAFIEMGIAITDKMRPIYLVGPVLPYGSAFTYAQNVFTAETVEAALKHINGNAKEDNP